MRHFYRTQLVPTEVLRIADEFFPEDAIPSEKASIDADIHTNEQRCVAAQVCVRQSQDGEWAVCGLCEETKRVTTKAYHWRKS